ncbi:uncharacterized protein N7477_005517 [Penicillium maclennaniae]|uniref:uncharacterized protein n=1 Tax=Penicillium maclennaniae TaxID=1343394 RepID=UPI002540C693|nr:uncharacterized protein N7477_005517 [Penicillium maclennaniae]KAJ5670154.1 hypothetical protein N7477_005517 [Penicillium maclennaniae]
MLLLAALISLALQAGVVYGDLLARAGPLVDATFDYVVVGGGTGGIVVGTRLAQHGSKVALVEGGGLYELESLAEVPTADVLLCGSDPNTQSAADWGFVTYGQPGANGRSIHYARGKCLGGSPTVESMQQWADTVNDSSYTFDNVLPYYKKSVQFTPPNSLDRAANASAAYNANVFESSGGPLQVSYANYAMPFSSWMKLGMEAIGINESKDFNSGTLMGAQYCSSTIDPSNELCSSSQASFLTHITPSTLTTYSSTLAKKIVFDSQKKATGVQVKGLLGNTVTLHASNEVIISAGTFQSPQLLMVSGVGPSDELQELGIDVVADLPGVGQNMWDHPFFAPTYRVQVDTLTKFANNLVYAAESVVGGLFAKTGPITNPVADYLAWEKIPQTLRSQFSQSSLESLAKFPSDWPEPR